MINAVEMSEIISPSSKFQADVHGMTGDGPEREPHLSTIEYLRSHHATARSTASGKLPQCRALDATIDSKIVQSATTWDTHLSCQLSTSPDRGAICIISVPVLHSTAAHATYRHCHAHTILSHEQETTMPDGIDARPWSPTSQISLQVFALIVNTLHHLCRTFRLALRSRHRCHIVSHLLDSPSQDLSSQHTTTQAPTMDEIS